MMEATWICVGWPLVRYPERRLNTFFAVSEILTDLVSHDFTDPLDVTTEAHTVFLYIDVAQFCDKPV